MVLKLLAGIDLSGFCQVLITFRLEVFKLCIIDVGDGSRMQKLEILISFTTSYLCDTGFFALFLKPNILGEH